MKIGVIQATSQKTKHDLLYECTKHAVLDQGYEVIDLGIRLESDANLSYVETAFLVYLLLESEAVDFVVTGCSSGQGMMLACNSFPGVHCAYTPTPSDAYLFGRINRGNAVSLPLGLHFGWAGELDLQYILTALFQGPFGKGYPPEDAPRKQKDTEVLTSLQKALKLSVREVWDRMDPLYLTKCLSHTQVVAYILNHGKNREVIQLLESEQ